MRHLNLNLILQATGGKLISPSSEKLIQNYTAVGTDTRVSLKNQVFFALKGDSFDAHDFLDKAVAAQAAAIVLSRENSEIILANPDIAFIKVSDTLKALQDLAHAWRMQSSALVLGITGSNGKTTSKEFTASVIGSQRKVHASKGSFNNHWGVPLSLLSEPEGSQVSVIEMGMNHAGELTELAKIAAPDVVVCTTVGRAHMEYFGTIENVAAAKEELYIASPATAQRIYNLDNAETAKMFAKAKINFPTAKKIWTFSAQDKTADVFLKIENLSMSSMRVSGTLEKVAGQTEIPVFGSQNLTNVMVAASLALASGLTPAQIWQALPLCKTNWGRNQLVHTKKGAEILFDAYNANPDSMRALIENLSLLKSSGKKIGVFAQMLELGSKSADLHRELGHQAGRAGFDLIWFYGADAESFLAGAQAAGFSKNIIISNAYEDSLASEVGDVLNRDDIALVKGSRGMKLERFVMACEPLDFNLNKS